MAHQHSVIRRQRAFPQIRGPIHEMPPIAEHRITLITDGTVTLWYKDKKLRRKS